MDTHLSLALSNASIGSRKSIMWTENHISRGDEVWNMIGCVFVIVTFIVVIVIGVGDVAVRRASKR